SNRVLIGPPTLLDVDIITGDRIIWCGRPQDLLDRGPLFIQVRAHGEAVPVATAKVENGELIVETAARIRGVAAGQAMVLYEGETVLGSATICRTGVQ
ncbi:MAG: hypothetical protein RL745_598, partial [Actinomycetota bacterium]